MKRTLNYTGRKTIYQDDARISVQSEPDGAFSFHADLDLSEYQLPGEASVYIEAYRQTTWMRFPWGTVAEPEPAQDRRLSDFNSPEEVLFRVKVVADAPHGQLIAEADRIRPRDPGDDDADRVPLLPVKPEDLGEEAWKVEIDGGVTRLLINSAFGDVHAVALAPEFRTLVYPAALRTVLRQALCERGTDGDLPSAGEPDEWQMRWVRFCQHLPGIGAGSDPFELGGAEEREQWIDECVRAFCRRQKLREVFPALGAGGQQ